MSRLAANLQYGAAPTSSQQAYQQPYAGGAGVGATTWALCDAFGEKFPVRDSFTVGSGRCDLVLPGHFDELVAVIERRQPHGHHVIRDLQSRDGTFVNGNRLRPDAEVALQAGDRVRFGRASEYVWQPVKTRPQQQRYQEVDIRPLSDAQGPMPLMRASARGSPDASALPTLGLGSRAVAPPLARPAPRQVWGNDVYIPRPMDTEPDELFDDDGMADHYDERGYAPEPADVVAARPPPAPRHHRPSQVARASTITALITPRDESSHVQHHAVGALNLSPRTSAAYPPSAAAQNGNHSSTYNGAPGPAPHHAAAPPLSARGSVSSVADAQQSGPGALLDKDECLSMIGNHLDRMQQFATACREKDAALAERTAEFDALRVTHAQLAQQSTELQARATRLEASEETLLQERQRLEADLKRTTDELVAQRQGAANHAHKLEEHLLTISVLQKSLRESDAARAEAVRAAESSTQAIHVAETALTAAAEQHATAIIRLQEELRVARSAVDDQRLGHDGAMKSLQHRLEELETAARAHTLCGQRESDLAGALAAVQGGQAQLLARVGAMLTADAVSSEADLLRVVDAHLVSTQTRDEQMRALEAAGAEARRTIDQLVADVTNATAAAVPLLSSKGVNIVDSLRAALPADSSAPKLREQILPALAGLVFAASQSLHTAHTSHAVAITTLTSEAEVLRAEATNARATETALAAECAQTTMSYGRLQAAMQAAVRQQPFEVTTLGPDASLFAAFLELLGAKDAHVETLRTERAATEESLQRQIAAARAEMDSERTAHASDVTAAQQHIQSFQSAATDLQSRLNALESALAASRAEKERVDGDVARGRAAASALTADLTAARAEIESLAETLSATRASESAMNARVVELQETLRSQQEETQIKLAHLRDLEGQLSTVQSSAAATMSTAQEELSSLQAAVALMRQQRTELQTLVAALQARIAEGEDQKVLREHEKTIAGLRRKVVELEGRLTDARAEVSDELKQQVRTLESQLQEAQASLKGAQDREVGEKQQQALTTATLRAQVETKARTIASLQDRIRATGDPSALSALADRDRASLERRVGELEAAVVEKDRLLREKDELLAVATEGAQARMQSDEGARQSQQRKSATEIQELRDRLAAVVREREEALAAARALRTNLASREGSLTDMQRQMQNDTSGSAATATAATKCVTAFRDAMRQLATALDVAGLPDLATEPVASGRVGAYDEDALHWDRHSRELVDQLVRAASGFRERVEDFPNQLRTLQGTLQAERSQLQAAADEHVGALRSKLARREAVLETYNSDLGALTELRGKVQAAEAAQADAVREATRLRGKIEDQQRAITKLTHDLEDSRRLCEELGHRSDARGARAQSATGPGLGPAGAGPSGARPSSDLRRQMGDTRERLRRGVGDYTGTASS